MTKREVIKVSGLEALKSVRHDVHKPTKAFKDKTKYTRKRKHKGDE